MTDSAGVAVEESSPTLAGLLTQLTALDPSARVVATRSLDWWSPGTLTPTNIDPREDGLWLIDTRDPEGRNLIRSLPRYSWEPGFTAALVISGSGQGGNPLRRLLRRMRNPGTTRLGPAHVHSRLGPIRGFQITTLAFEDGPDVPTDFRIGDADPASGGAFLLTRDAPFAGSFWSSIPRWLGDPAARLTAIQLRVRGAGFATFRGRDGTYVVRIVPPSTLQDVVRINHSALVELRSILHTAPDVLARMPEPVFARQYGATLLLGETFVEGVAAWKASQQLRSGRIRGDALGFLRMVRDASLARVSGTFDEIDALFRDDLSSLGGATFVSDQVRSLLLRELLGARDALVGFSLDVHASHGDFGYGNILIDPASGAVNGVIDWDTARIVDLPGIDRVNLEIQIRRSDHGESFAEAVQQVWTSAVSHEALGTEGGPKRVRSLFGAAVCRYIVRALRYPSIYDNEARGFAEALGFLGQLPG